jgi:long-chain acyl-CoA synthetase
MATLEAGAVGVLLNHRDPETRVASRVAFTSVRFLLHDSSAPAANVERSCSFEEFRHLSSSQAGAKSAVPPNPTDAALIFFTSGTTGAPKAVVQSHYSVAQNALSLTEHHAIRPGQRLMCVLPLHHVNGLEFTILSVLLGGAHVFISRGFDGLQFWPTVGAHDIHIVSLVPNLLRLLADRPGLRGQQEHQLRYAVSAAAPLSTNIATSAYTRLGLRIVQGYGLSEVTNFSCLMPPGISDEAYERWMLHGRRTSIGPALPGQEVQILGAGGPALPEEEGEVLIRGHCVMSGYLHNEKATEEAFEGGWFHTGDLGYFLPDDSGLPYIHISGRIRDIAKRSGAMVNLLEVDEALVSIEGVADAAAAAFPNRWVDEEIGAIVVRGAQSELDEHRVIEHCRRLLPFPEVPKAIVFVDEVPRTATGKVRRSEIGQNFAHLQDRLFTERPPRESA